MKATRWLDISIAANFISAAVLAAVFVWYVWSLSLAARPTPDHRAQCEAHQLVYIPAADVCVAGFRPWGQP